MHPWAALPRRALGTKPDSRGSRWPDRGTLRAAGDVASEKALGHVLQERGRFPAPGPEDPAVNGTRRLGLPSEKCIPALF